MEKAPVRKIGTLPAEFLDLAESDDFSPAGDIEYDLTASLVSGGALVSGRISTEVHSSCGRCLKPVDIFIGSEDINIFFELVPGQEILDAGEDVRAELLLELPMNPLCSEDCRGLCLVCGNDLNEKECSCGKTEDASAVSPWSALDDLKL